MSPPLRASNGGWFIWSISSIWFVWLVGPEIHPEEPDRPERPSNQTDEPVRVARAQGTHRAIPLPAGGLFGILLDVAESTFPYAPLSVPACLVLRRGVWRRGR